MLAVRTIIFVGPPAALCESRVLIMSRITHRHRSVVSQAPAHTGYAAAAILRGAGIAGRNLCGIHGCSGLLHLSGNAVKHFRSRIRGLGNGMPTACPVGVSSFVATPADIPSAPTPFPSGGSAAGERGGWVRKRAFECSTERKYPTDKPWAFIQPTYARTAQGGAQGLACKSDSYFSNGARGRNRTVTVGPLHEVGRRGHSEQPHDLGLVILGRT